MRDDRGSIPRRIQVEDESARIQISGLEQNLASRNLDFLARFDRLEKKLDDLGDGVNQKFLLLLERMHGLEKSVNTLNEERKTKGVVLSTVTAGVMTTLVLWLFKVMGARL
jgi:hypothetical protein